MSAARMGTSHHALQATMQCCMSCHTLRCRALWLSNAWLTLAEPCPPVDARHLEPIIIHQRVKVLPPMLFLIFVPGSNSECPPADCHILELAGSVAKLAQHLHHWQQADVLWVHRLQHGGGKV